MGCCPSSHPNYYLPGISLLPFTNGSVTFHWWWSLLPAGLIGVEASQPFEVEEPIIPTEE
jgi:hypothetical protein